MKLQNFLNIIIESGQETAKQLKSVSAKMEFYLKVVTLVLSATDVRIELEENTGMRDLGVKRVAHDVIEKLKAQPA